MGSFKNVGKRVLSGLLCAATSFSLLTSTSGRVAHADSNNRMQVNIQWAQNKGFTEMNAEDLSSLTYDDLLMIGMFLSNFYVPFSTCLGGSMETDEIKETQDNMVSTLVNQCNFDEEVAEFVVPLVWEMSLSTAQPLYIGKFNASKKSVGSVAEDTADYGQFVNPYNKHFYDEGDEQLYHLDVNNLEAYKGSYYNFLVTFAGGAQTKGEKNYMWHGPSQDVCLYWVDDSGNRKIVLDSKTSLCDPGDADWDSNERRKGKMSASVLAYCLLNDRVAYDYGIGASIFGVSSYDEFKDLSSADQETAAVTSSQLYVDCFGNIILDWAGVQYLMLPACTNPYAWYDTYKDGVNASEPSSAGETINLVNTYFLAEAENGAIQVTDASDTTNYSATTDISQFLSNEKNSRVLGTIGQAAKAKQAYVYMYDGDKSLLNLYYFRDFRGSTTTKLDTKTFGNSDKTKLVWDNLKNGAIIEIDAKGEENDYLRFPNFGTYVALTTETKLNGVQYERAAVAGSKGTTSEEVSLFQDMCMIDNVRELSSDDSSTIKTQLLFSPDTNEFLSKAGLGGKMQFSAIKEKNKMVELSATTAKAYTVSIFLSYVYAFYDESEGADRKVRWAFNKGLFPRLDGNLDFSDIEINSTKMYDETLSLAYLFLHPKEGAAVIKTWVKNKVSAVLVGWHEDMVGKAGATSTTGSTKYIGFSGYVTLPSLDDLEWTAFLMDSYDELVVYFIIIILIILLGYKMIGSLTWQKVVLSGLLFAFCAYLPPRLINATVDVSNSICNSIYGSKFTYWALVQHEQYASALKTAVNEGNEWNYLSTIFNQQAKDSADNYALVTVKWQCPKKENYWADVQEEITQTSSASLNKFIMPLVRDVIDGETYENAANNQYLYRSYTDLGTYANSLYHNGEMVSLSTYGDTGSNSSSSVAFKALYEDMTSKGYTYGNKYQGTVAKNKWLNAYRKPYLNNPREFNTAYSEYDTKTVTSYMRNISLGFNFDTVRQSSSSLMLPSTGMWLSGDTRYSTNRRMLDFSYCASVNLAWMRGLNTLQKATAVHGTGFEKFNSVYGVPLETFNTTLADVNGRADGAMGGISSQEYTKDSEVASLVFANYTESPFLYFSYNLNDQLKSASVRGEASTYKDLFLLPNGSYFYNMLSTDVYGNVKSDGSGQPASDGYGELRDYMDMRSLFYIVIPYLKSLNDVVVEYDNVYGLFMYDDVKLEYDSNNNIVLPEELKKLTSTNQYLGDSSLSTEAGETYYKYIHNWEVAQLLNMYTPWVDVMYDCEYSNGENIYVLGEKFYVRNPLDPLSYYEDDGNGNITKGREMIFSRSEMTYYGLSMEDLTQVEQKIITINDNCYADLLQIIDYYNFQPEVLNTAIAMLETFEFNRQFSETSLLGEDYVLYPQNYELKNFSYDAYLRLILAGTTGQDLNSMEGANIYSTVVQNSSILTGILFIFLDLFAVYAIPALKLFFIIGIFFMSILMILVATIRLEVKLSKALGESLVFPLLKFLGVTVGMAWLVSLFMYNGNTAVTGRTSRVISLGDPTMVILVMLIINIAVLILYWKICKGVIKDCKKYATAVGNSVGGMFGGALTMFGAGALLGGRRAGVPQRTPSPTSSPINNARTPAPVSTASDAGSSSPSTPKGNKYDAKIDKIKAKRDQKANIGMEKLSAKENLNSERGKLADTYREYSNDSSIKASKRKHYEKKANRLDKQRAMGEKKVEKSYSKLEARDTKRGERSASKLANLERKSNIARGKSAIKGAKKSSRVVKKK